jgi:hypothetical protein
MCLKEKKRKEKKRKFKKLMLGFNQKYQHKILKSMILDLPLRRRQL